MDEQIKLAEEAFPLAFGKIMRGETEDMTVEEKTDSYALLGLMGDMIEKRRKIYREDLLKLVEAHGEEGDSGHNVLVVNGSQVIRERRESKTPNTEGIQRLLEARNMPITSAFDERMVLELNVSKVEHLVALGKLPKEEVAALKSVTYALKVKPSPRLQQLLEEAPEPKRSKKRLVAK